MAPFTNGLNGHGHRDQLGRFRPGNRAASGRGNPHADRVNAWRTTLARTVTEADLRAVIASLVERARAGERWAVCELLDRCLGKPAQQVAPTDEKKPQSFVFTFSDPCGPPPTANTAHRAHTSVVSKPVEGT